MFDCPPPPPPPPISIPLPIPVARSLICNQIRYNQKRIDIFSRQRILRYVMKPWINYFVRATKVKFCHQKHMAKFVKANFEALAALTKVRRRQRRLTLANWKEYPLLMMEKPFRAWAEHYRASKNHLNEQMRIVNAYVRWKTRQWLMLIMRTWRHQVSHFTTQLFNILHHT